MLDISAPTSADEMIQGESSDNWRREGGRRLRLGLCSRGKEEEDPAKETGKKWSGKQEDHRETVNEEDRMETVSSQKSFSLVISA